MKSINIILLLICISASVFSQKPEIKVAGTLKGSDGQPIPGVTILIKGTTKGVITDINGNYVIQAPLGSTLEFLFIGMKTKEAIVTLTGLNPVGTRTIIPYNTDPEASKLQSQIDKERQAREKQYKERMERYCRYLSIVDNDSYLSVYQPIDTATLKQMRRTLRMFNDYQSPFKLGKIEVNSNTSVYWAGRIPGVQTGFSQGRPMNGTWLFRGPETGETYSWGPKIVNLEYDGVASDYDIYGSLVNRESGNGQSANRFASDKLFRMGYSTNNTISIYQMMGKLSSSFSYGNVTSKGVLPGMDHGSHLISAMVKNNQLEVWINYSRQTSHWQNGILQARTLYSALVTPPSFDNANGLSVRDAARSSSAVYTPSGKLRSFAPGQVDNPFYLLQTVDNPFEGENLSGNLSYQLPLRGAFTAKIHGGGEWFSNDQTLAYGNQTALLPSGSMLNRRQEFQSVMGGWHLEYHHYKHNELLFQFPVFVSHSSHNIRSSSSVTSLFDFPQPSLKRTYWSSSPAVVFNRNDLGIHVQAGGQLYHSSTAGQNDLSPFVGVGFKPLNLVDELFVVNTSNAMDIKFTLNYNRPVKEYDLKYSYGTGNSLRYDVSDFAANLNHGEIGIVSGIKPEIANHLNGGVHVWVLDQRISSDFEIYRNRTDNAIYPVWVGDQQLLTNVGDITVTGWEESLSFRFGYYRSLEWQATVSASHSQSRVDRLDSPTPVPIAGFRDVHTTLVEGQSVGVIVGSRYLRNENGQRVIGDDGFPLVDSQLGVIADPTPDMMLGLNNNFTLNGFSLGFTVQAQIGGSVWNGTRATLDYYGVSAQTAQLRYEADYIFDGVTQSGSTNSVAVSLAPKDQPLESNRWVRYGKGGVTEDYIEDASNVVLKELKLSYVFDADLVQYLGLYSLTTTVVATNLLTITGYRGVEPAGSLWGHANGNALDFFNMPMVRSVGFNLKLTF